MQLTHPNVQIKPVRLIKISPATAPHGRLKVVLLLLFCYLWLVDNRPLFGCAIWLGDLDGFPSIEVRDDRF